MYFWCFNWVSTFSDKYCIDMPFLFVFCTLLLFPHTKDVLGFFLKAQILTYLFGRAYNLHNILAFATINEHYNSTKNCKRQRRSISGFLWFLYLLWPVVITASLPFSWLTTCFHFILWNDTRCRVFDNQLICPCTSCYVLAKQFFWWVWSFFNSRFIDSSERATWFPPYAKSLFS